MLILYTVTIFLGALLLFLVQPMVGRMLLPLLGGAPAVWNTALVFYQAVLLAGYAYVHFTTRWLGVRRQAVLHFCLLLLASLALPIVVPRGWTPPSDHNPVLWLLALLAVMVGLPFWAVSAMSPLLQRWFSAGSHRDAADPYFLYAASNAGSLIALLAYPLFLEPYLRLSDQSRWWSVAYVVMAVLTTACGLWVWRTVQDKSPAAATRANVSIEPLTTGRRWRWVLLAFVPCSLMLSVTTYVTSEVAPIPLLWVIPLGIYLMTFILVFAKRRIIPHRWMLRALPFAVLLLVELLVKPLTGQAFESPAWPMALHFSGLFIIAMACHGELANDRPSAAHLTEFYLWISVGGVLGGIFNALLAPVIFSTVLEYPVTLVLACLLMPRRDPRHPDRRAVLWDFVLPLVLGLFTAGLFRFLGSGPGGPQGISLAIAFGLPPVLCLALSRRPLRFALAVLAIMLATTWSLQSSIPTPLVARSFFGIHRVELFPGHEYIHFLRHGTTMHGVQSLNPNQRRIPLLYYTRSGPLGQVIAALPDELKRHVAAVGLGAGTAACYGQPGQQWTFYEIDPEVERIARDPRYFTYLQDCPAQVNVVLGDARLSLQAAPDGQYGLMILDAYSSDTIPLHLVTREALALYLRKLSPSGVLAFHITNRHVDLEPVLASLARDAHLFALYQRDPVTLEESQSTGKVESRWVVMTRDPLQFSALERDQRWQPPREQEGVGVWTDDYASLFRVFMWQ